MAEEASWSSELRAPGNTLSPDCEPLCPVRGDDLPAGVVRISGPAPRAASLGMRSVRLQVRDPGHVPRPIVCIFRAPATPREEPPAVSGGSAFGSWALAVTNEATPISRAEFAPQIEARHCRRWRQRSPVSLTLAGDQIEDESSRACGSAFSSVAGCAPAGNCSTVAR
jgi:hypothetical protein